jgi:hypothetical protein
MTSRFIEDAKKRTSTDTDPASPRTNKCKHPLEQNNELKSQPAKCQLARNTTKRLQIKRERERREREKGEEGRDKGKEREREILRPGPP